MGIYLNDEITASSIIVNNMYSKIKSNTSQFRNVDTEEFDSILKNNNKTDDKKKNNELYKSDVKDTEKENLRNKELKKMMDKGSLERMMFNFSQNLNNIYSSPLVNGIATQAIKSFV